MEYQPHFYLWVFSPRQGKVIDVADAHEDHPLDVRNHSDLASEANEPNLIHGFAGRAEGGWRISDIDGKAITDPFIKRKVKEALSIEPEDLNQNQYPADFDRLQYGKPMRTIQTDG